MLNKKALFLFTLIACQIVSYSQKTTEFGFILGRSYYNGEMNPKTHLGNGVGSIAYGLVFRYNLNERYSLKASVIRGKLTGQDSKSDFGFNRVRNAAFESRLTEFSGQIEFNFLPYETGHSKHFFTPFLFVGAAGYQYAPETIIDGVENEGKEVAGGTKFAMPFGLGMKLSAGNKLNLNFEWGFRRISNDSIDGLPNRFAEIYELGKTYDSDWYSIAGFSLTFKLTRVGPCPVYRF